jgi:hypothetical protein
MAASSPQAPEEPRAHDGTVISAVLSLMWAPMGVDIHRRRVLKRQVRNRLFSKHWARYQVLDPVTSLYGSVAAEEA